MDLTFAADRRCVAKPRCHLLDGAGHIFLGADTGIGCFELHQRLCGQHRARPGAKIFRGDCRAGDLLELIVHIRGGYSLGLAITIDILKEMLAGKLLTALHDLGHAPVADAKPP